MSIEYSADVALDDAGIAVVASRLAALGYQDLRRPTLRSISFRLRCDLPPRERWSHDVDIAFGEDVHVAVHAGSRDERSRLISALEEILEQLGHSCSICER